MHPSRFLANLDVLRPSPEILADWLTENAPATPVRLHHLPNWLRLAWLRSPGARVYRRGWRGISSHDVFLEMQGLLNLDHWGSTILHDHLCFVNEPYQDVGPAYEGMRRLAELVGNCYPACDRTSHWGYGTVRALLIPGDRHKIYRHKIVRKPRNP